MRPFRVQVSEAAIAELRQVIHAAAGELREYRVGRTRQSDLVKRIEWELRPDGFSG